MQVSQLAKDNNIEENVILDALKTLKMKATGAEQELSPAVLAILKGALSKQGIDLQLPEPKQSVVKKKAVKKTVVKKKTATKVVKKTTKKAVKKASTALTSTEEELEEEGKTPEEIKEEKAARKRENKVPKIIKSAEVSEVEAIEASLVIKPVEEKNDDLTVLDSDGQTISPAEVGKKDDVAADESEESLEEERKKKGNISKHKAKKLEKERRRQIQQLQEDEEDYKLAPARLKAGETPELVTVTPLKKKPMEPMTPIAPRRGKRGQKAPAQDFSNELPKVEGPLKDLEIKVPITVNDLAVRMGFKVNLVLKKLIMMGVFANINQVLNEEQATQVAKDFGFNIIKEKSNEEQVIDIHAQEDSTEDLQTRAPVVTVMGHVDHGKTSLLDYIRDAKVADREHGGITQHIGAYSVQLEKGKITFLDTPGHEAFTAMRARGAQVTDVVVIVIAADDGIKPQTQEAIDHAKAANVPMVIALNKIDLPNADPDRVKKELMEIGLMPEEWGGKTVVVGVSAKTGDGIDELLEMILLESEMLELKANPDRLAAGMVVEAHLSPGKGAMASIIVQNGTLKMGDFVIVGEHYCKVKAMLDDHGRNIAEAGPSMPVEILGLSDVPSAGEQFYVVETEKQAREIAQQRQEFIRNERLKTSSAVSLESFFAEKEEGEVKELSVIIKADVQGSLEALKESILKITQHNKEVKTKFIHTGIGSVNASDVILANASKAIIIAFHVTVEPKAQQELSSTPVDIREYKIIYDAVEDIKNALEGMLEIHVKRHFQSKALVKQVFNLSSGIIAGCIIEQGKVKTKSKADIVRNGDVIFTGALESLKRYKDDVKEVPEGTECGIAVAGFKDYQEGDIINTFEEERITRKL